MQTIVTSEISLNNVPMFSPARNERGKIGLVLVPNEQTIEADFIRHLPEGVGVHCQRANIPSDITDESLALLKGEIANAAGTILPHDRVDIVAMASTSGTIAVGENAAETELARGAKGAKTSTIAGAIRRAMGVLNVKRVAIVTPYTDDVNTKMRGYFTEAGFEIVSFYGMQLQYDAEMIRVSPEYLIELAKTHDTPDADALLLSCSALRAIEVIEPLEQQLGKPVLCSNQALMWDCLRKLGIDDKLPGLGRLLREH
jgi:maleate isomerase